MTKLPTFDPYLVGDYRCHNKNESFKCKIADV